MAPGCSHYYNGALGFRGDDMAEASLYQQQLAQRERDAVALNELDAAMGDYPPARVGFDGQIHMKPTPALAQDIPAPAPAPPAPAADPQDKPAAQPETTFVTTEPAPQPVSPPQGQPRTQRRGPVSMFGDLPEITDRVSPMDSTGPIRRMSYTAEGADFDVTTDATGRWMLFSSTRHREASDIYRQRVGGESVTQLTDDPGNDVMPTLSPDGRTIAFASDRGGNWDIYLMDANGGPAVQLTSDRTHDLHPSFSPDGKRLVYCSFGERTGQWEMVVVDIDNPATKRYLGHGLFPQWSPTDDTIVFQRARERGTRWFSVWTVELNSDGEAGSPTEIAWSSEHACITPSWSPDGSAVVFCTVSDPEADSNGDQPLNSDVWLVNVDGSGRTRLTAGRFSNLQPTWSADNTVYFVSNRGREGVENIWAIDTGEAMQMVRRGGADSPTTTVGAPTQSD